MRTITAALTLCLLSLAGIASPQTPEAAVPRISLADFKKALQAGEILVVDVRDAKAYADGHIPGAILVPLGQLDQHVAELKTSKKPIVTYCA